jgi:RHS repeat-associated protein
MLRQQVSVQQPSASLWSQSYGYDTANRLKTISSPAGSFTYIYDPGLNGNVTSSALVDQINLPNGAGITNTFDNDGRMTATLLRNSTGTTLDLYDYLYNKGNQRTNVVRGSVNANYVNYSYDPIGQVVSDKASDVSGAVRLNEQVTYAYDHAHNLAYRTNNTLVQNFQVNSVNELTTQTNGGRLTVVGTTTSPANPVTVNGTNAYYFGDAIFAATNMPLTNVYTAIAQDTYGRHSTNAVTVSLSTNSTFLYDGNGNLTNDGLRNFAYDDENELIQVAVSNQWMSRFSYDGQMRRRIRTELTWTNSAWTQTNQVFYVYDGARVIQERNQENLPMVMYTRGKDMSGSLEAAGGIGGLLARTDATSGQTACYHSDANGNVTMLVNSTNAIVAKYLYDAFGNLLSKSGVLADANLYRFSSKEAHPNSGFAYYLYRYYDPNFQRWPNRDPLGELGFEILHHLNQPAVIKKIPLGSYTWSRGRISALGFYNLLLNKQESYIPNSLAEFLNNSDPYGFLGNRPLTDVDSFGLWTWGGVWESTKNVGEGIWEGIKHVFGPGTEPVEGLKCGPDMYHIWTNEPPKINFDNSDDPNVPVPISAG